MFFQLVSFPVKSENEWLVIVEILQNLGIYLLLLKTNSTACFKVYM